MSTADIMKRPYPRQSAKLAAERDRRLAELGPRPPWWRPFARRRHDARRAAVLALDCSQFAEMLRELYPAELAAELAGSNHVLFARISKAPRDGQSFVTPVTLVDLKPRQS